MLKDDYCQLQSNEVRSRKLISLSFYNCQVRFALPVEAAKDLHNQYFDKQTSRSAICKVKSQCLQAGANSV